MAFETIDLTPRIDTEIKSDIPTLVSGSHATQIRELLEQRGVLVIRGLSMNDEQQLTLDRTLGKLQLRGEDGIFKITIDPGENPVADYTCNSRE